MFIVSTYVGSVPVAEHNEKQNLAQSYRNKYQRHIDYIYGYELAYVDDNFSQPFKTQAKIQYTALSSVRSKKVNIAKML